MLKIFRKKYGVDVCDIFFWHGPFPAETKADIVLFVQTDTCHASLQPFFTIHIDLTQEIGSIEAALDKNTRYEIRRAASKQEVRCEIVPVACDDKIGEFAVYYDAFAKTKKLQPCNVDKLRALRDEHALVLTKAMDSRTGEVLCWHAYVVDDERARLLYSASLFRSVSESGLRALIGRANRYLHWYEMIHFKSLSVRIYDLGGITGGADQMRAGIDDFKAGFGGRQVTEYSGPVGVSWLGRSIIAFGRLRG